MSQKKKCDLNILHIVAKMDRGGAETFIVNNLKELSKEGLKFNFLVSNKGAYDEFIQSKGGKIYITSNPKKNLMKYIFDLIKCIKKWRINVIHSHMFAFSGIILLIGKLMRVRVRIVHSHSAIDENKSIFFKIMKNLVDYSATNRVACGEASGICLYGSEKFIVINNAIDISRFRELERKEKLELRHKLKISKETVVIGSLARLESVKNHKFMLEVFSEYLKINHNAILLIVGEGSQKKVIEAQIKALKLENKVNLVGVKEDVEKYLNIFDVFFMPSIYEGIPLSIIEAQAVNTKCFLSDTISKEVDIGCGLVEYFSLQDQNIHGKIEKLLKKDKKIINTHEYIVKKGFDITTEAKKLLSIYER